MDKIHLNQMAFYGYHGLFKEEKKLGQRFLVDLTLFLDLKKAGKSDAMEDSVDYGVVYQKVKEVVEGQSRNLVESVAEEVASNLLTTLDKLDACFVKVYKPDPPIPGHYQSVAVEIYRERE